MTASRYSFKIKNKFYIAERIDHIKGDTIRYAAYNGQQLICYIYLPPFSDSTDYEEELRTVLDGYLSERGY
jgi:hypothetical protein